MRTCKEYLAPEVEIILVTEDIVRTSPGDKGELPFQPFGGGDSSIFG